MLRGHHPCRPGHRWAGSTLQLGERSYSPAAGSKVTGCWTWRGSHGTRHGWYPSTLQLCVERRDYRLSHRLCSHPFPKGRSKCSEVLILLFSLPFQTTHSLCCASAQRKAAQSSVPYSFGGSGEIWGVPWTERSSFHSAGKEVERVVGRCFVLEGHSPSRTLPLLRSLQVITIIIQKKMSENNPAIFAFRLSWWQSWCGARRCRRCGFRGMGEGPGAPLPWAGAEQVWGSSILPSVLGHGLAGAPGPTSSPSLYCSSHGLCAAARDTCSGPWWILP